MSRLRTIAAVMVCLLAANAVLLAHDPHDPFVLVAISPNYAVDQTLLAGSGGLTVKLDVVIVVKSTDGGATWSAVPGLPVTSSLSGLAFSPGYAQDQTMFACSSNGLFKSTNQGSSWSTVSSDNLIAMALSPNFAGDNTMYVVTSTNQILKSTNRGKTLTAVSTPGALTSPITAIAISPNYGADQTVLIGSTSNGAFKTVNAGATWTQVINGASPTVTAIAFSPFFGSDQTAFAGTLGSGFLVSTNSGNSFVSSNAGLTDLNVTAISLSPTYATDASLWVTTAVGGVFQSASQGASWNPPVTVSRLLSDLTTIHYQAIYAGPGVQLLAMFEGLWISYNAGASWQYVDTIPTRLMRYINLSPNYALDQTVFINTYGSGNLWTYNGGITWVLQNTGMQAPYTDASGISPNFANDQTAFSGNHLGLQSTNNGGATWSMLTGPGQSAYPRGFAISPNFAADNTVYIGTSSTNNGGGDVAHVIRHSDKNTPSGLWVSTNAGQNWTLSSLKGKGIDYIAFSPAFATDQTAYAANQDGGVYMTTNAASTWTKLKLPVPGNKGMGVVVVSPSFAQDGNMLVAGLTGYLFLSTNRGASFNLVSGTKNLRVMAAQFSPNYAADRTIFIGTVQNGLMMSTNGAASFSTVTTFPDVFCTAVGISPSFANDRTVYAAGYHGLYKSIDGGNTWVYQVTPARIEETRNINSILQEPPTITYSGAWSFNTSAAASTNGDASTPEAQDTAVFSFLGSGLRWLSWTGPEQGAATLSLDGNPLGVISLAANLDGYQQTVWEQHGLACGQHTFTITATPQAAQNVSLDAFDVWTDSCPYATYSNPASLSENAITVGSTAGSGSVFLNTPGPWLATSNAPWLTLSPGSAAGTGSTLIQFSYPANPNPFAQTGTLTIAGLTFIVTQAGQGSAPVYPITPLVASGLTDPLGVAVDSTGNVYIADSGDNAIKEWQPSTQQLIPLVTSGISGPWGVALDVADNVYFTDTGDNAIKEWSVATQQVNTLVSGLNEPTGIALDTQGNIYFANTGANAILEWQPATQQLITLVSSGLNAPAGVAVDALGYVYFADSGNNAIKEWSPATQQVDVLVSSGINSPLGVAVDGFGDVYFSDTGDNAVDEWSPTTQQVTTLASAGLNYPAGLAVDTHGNVYIADANNNAVRELSQAYLQLSATSLNELSTAGSDMVTAQVVPGATVLSAISDQSWLAITGIFNGGIDFTFQANPGASSRVGHINVLGLIVTVTQAGSFASLNITAGNNQTSPLGSPFTYSLQVTYIGQSGAPGEGIPVTFTVTPGANGAGASFSPTPPMPLLTDVNGEASSPLLVANNIAGPFTVIASTGSLSATFYLTNTGDSLASYGELTGSAAGSGTVLLSAGGAWTATSNSPWLTVTPAGGTGNALVQFSYTANNSSSVQVGTLTIDGLTFVVTQAGSSFVPVQAVTPLVTSGLSGPLGIAVNPGGSSLYIADSGHNAVETWTAGTGQVSVLVSNGLSNPAAVAVDSLGNVYIADQGNNAIEEWQAATRQVISLISSGIASPSGVAADGQGNVYYSDSGNAAIEEWSPATGQVSTLVSGLGDPWGVALDAQNNVYFTDSTPALVEEWPPELMQLMPLVSAGLSSPRGVAVDSGGNVYIADEGNRAIDVWNPVTQQLTPYYTSGLQAPSGIAVDGNGNVYFSDAGTNSVVEITAAYLYLGAGSMNENATAGSNTVAVQVLPVGTALSPASTQSWLTILGVANGAISFSFSANTSATSRTAYIELLGQQVAVTQAGDVAATLMKAAGNDQSAAEAQPFAKLLQAKVTDAQGNLIVGAPVTFTVAAGSTGAIGSFASSPSMPVLTNSKGIAFAPALTAGSVAGTFTVQATSGSATVKFTETVTAP